MHQIVPFFKMTFGSYSLRPLSQYSIARSLQNLLIPVAKSVCGNAYI